MGQDGVWNQITITTLLCILSGLLFKRNGYAPFSFSHPLISKQVNNTLTSYDTKFLLPSFLSIHAFTRLPCLLHLSLAM